MLMRADQKQMCLCYLQCLFALNASMSQYNSVGEADGRPPSVVITMEAATGTFLLVEGKFYLWQRVEGGS